MIFLLQVTLASILYVIPVLKLSPVKLKLKEIFIYLTIQYSVVIIVSSVSEFLLSLSVLIGGGIFLYLKIKNYFLSMLLSMLNVMISLISDVLIGNVYIYLIRINPQEYFSNTVNYICFVLLCILCCYVISSFMNYILNQRIKILEIKFIGIQSFFIMIMFLSSIIMIYCNMLLGKTREANHIFSTFNGLFLPLYFVIMVIIIFYLLVSIQKDIQIKQKDQLLANIKIYTKEMENMYNSLRNFKHDYSNIILSMSTYLIEKDFEGLDQYFFETIAPTNKYIISNAFKIGELQNLEIIEVKGIIAVKAIMAQDKGIDVVIDISEKITSINMDIVDLNRIMGILLDNAIEEAIECKSPYIKFAIIKEAEKIVFIILNSCTSETKDIEQLFEAGFSTKGDNRGLGLSSLQDIIKNYHDILLDVSIRNFQFKIILEIEF